MRPIRLAPWLLSGALAGLSLAARAEGPPARSGLPQLPFPQMPPPKVAEQVCLPPIDIFGDVPADSGPQNTCGASSTSSIDSYNGGNCTIPDPYRGEDEVYEIQLTAGNSVEFILDIEGSAGDLVLALVGTCGDGTSCVRNSPDFIGAGVGPETIPTASYPPGIYYLYVDSAIAAGIPGDPSCGSYRLRVTGTNTPRPDLAITMTDSPDPVIAGTELEYVVTVTNDSRFTATGVTVSDTLPSRVTWRSSPSCSHSGGTVTCAIAAIAPGATAIRRITVDVVASFDGSLLNEATVSLAETDPVLSNNRTGQVETMVEKRTDLAIAGSAAPDPVFAGTDLTYTLAATNRGPSNATGVVVTDTLPEGVSFISASQATCSHESGAVTCVIDDDWPANKPVVGTIRVRVDPSVRGAINNHAEIRGDEDDPNNSNNGVTLATEVRGKADLEITKVGAPDPVIAGNDLTYLLTITNGGPSDATGVTVIDTLPPELIVSPEICTDANVIVTCPDPTTVTLTYRENPACEIEIPIADLSPGAMKECTIQVPVDPSLRGVITNQAEVNGDETDPNPNDNEDMEDTTIIGVANLEITKTGPGEVIAGTNLTYTLTVTNNEDGPSDATGVTVIDTLPPELIVSPEICTDANVIVTCPDPTVVTLTYREDPACEIEIPIADLSPGAMKECTIQVPVDPSLRGVITNQAEVYSAETDPNPNDNEDMEDTTIIGVADLEITKTGPGEVIAGTNLTYTLTITNGGPSDATGGTVTDLLPDGLSFVSSPDDCTEDSGTVTCRFEAVPDGEEMGLRFVAAVASSATGAIGNSATVTGNEDPETSNDGSGEIMTAVGIEADLSVIQTDRPDPAVSGGLVTYTLTVTNDGPSDMDVTEEVELTDTLPPEVSSVSVVCIEDPRTCDLAEACECDPLDCSTPPVEVTCNLGHLAAGATAIREITGTVEAAAPFTLTNLAEVTGHTGDPDPDNNTAGASTTVADPGDSDLAVVVIDSPDPVIPGRILTYSLTVANNGPADATDVTVIDTLPAAVSFLSASGGCTELDGTVTCIVGALAKEDQTDLQILAEVGPAAVEPLTNLAGVDHPGIDPNDGNDTASESTAVLAVPALVLPHFAVDTEDPDDPDRISTLFAVRNGTDAPVTVEYEYGGADGEPVADAETLDLDPAATRTVNIRDQLPAAAGLSRGYVGVTAIDSDTDRPLSGDYFRIDPTNAFANGSLLVETDTSSSPPGLCRRWDTRFFNGGGFDGGTDFVFYVPENGVEVAAGPIVVGTVYNEDGDFVQEIPIETSDQTFERSSTEDFDLLARFGAIEWIFRDGVVGHVAGIFKAFDGRFSVGVPGFCQAETSSGPLVLPYFEVDPASGLTTLFAVRNGSEEPLRARYEVFSAEGDLLADPEEYLEEHATRTFNLEHLLPDGAAGYVVITVVDPDTGEPLPDRQVLNGDYFRFDPGNDLASGSALIHTGPSSSPSRLCRRWDLRFFNGGAFAGGTDFTFYVPGNPGGSEPVVTGTVYDESGNLVNEIEIVTSELAFERSADVLELGAPFGAIEWQLREGLVGHIGATFSASGGYSVGLPGVCRDDPEAD